MIQYICYDAHLLYMTYGPLHVLRLSHMPITCPSYFSMCWCLLNTLYSTVCQQLLQWLLWQGTFIFCMAWVMMSLNHAIIGVLIVWFVSIYNLQVYYNIDLYPFVKWNYDRRSIFDTCLFLSLCWIIMYFWCALCAWGTFVLALIWWYNLKYHSF